MNRSHIHVNVDDLDTSIAFYTNLFWHHAVGEKDGYAKWMLDDPTVNFAISVREGAKPGLNHVGLQWETFYTMGDATTYGPDASDVIYAAIGNQPGAKGKTTDCC